jgi:hypothetical protein
MMGTSYFTKETEAEESILPKFSTTSFFIDFAAYIKAASSAFEVSRGYVFTTSSRVAPLAKSSRMN